MTEEKIARINALYHKSKNQGLSEEEKAEQQALREEYIASIRNNMRQTLESVKIQRPDGSITPVQKVKNRKIQ
ncbi:MAG: DUF896 domain-containing protein [Lachnospiraceae bacterium]|nr:DUF896 domain-containing protein [Lachnospiraceae bacterium]